MWQNKKSGSISHIDTIIAKILLYTNDKKVLKSNLQNDKIKLQTKERSKKWR